MSKKNHLFGWQAFRLIFMVLIAVIGDTLFLYGGPITEKAPYDDAVMKILAPLKYTGVEDIIGADSKLSVDFNNKMWIVYSTHHFDSLGRIILDDGDGGLCDELSVYVYGKIKALFSKDRFGIKFAKVKERNYFDTPQATHIVIIILDKRRHQEYLLDPSFKKYGKKDDFKNYYSFKDLDADAFLKEYNQSPDNFFEVDFATPLLIRHGYLITFSIESVNKKFDKDHFILAIAATKQRSTTSSYVFALRCRRGHVKVDIDEGLLKQLLTPEETARLIQRLMEWANAVYKS